MSKYMVRTERPNNWTGDGYRSFDCREEAEDYAKAQAYGTPDQEYYVLATPFITLEAHDRLIREAKAEALTAAADAFDAATINVEIFTAGSSEREYYRRSNELRQILGDSLRKRAQQLKETP
jgi:hypothetical protein